MRGLRDTQADGRHPTLVGRCGQCGQLQAVSPAAVISLAAHRHLLSNLLCLWTVLVSLGIVGMVGSQVSVTMLTLFGLTTHQRVSAAEYHDPGYTGPGYRLVAKPAFEEYRYLAYALTIFPLGIAFAGGVVAAVTLGHYRWWQFGLMILGVPIVSLAIVFGLWTMIASYLLSWAIPIIASHGLAQLVGSVFGVLSGRWIMSPLIRCVLPTRLRRVMTFQV